MKLKATVTEISFSVKLTKKQWETLDDLDFSTEVSRPLQDACQSRIDIDYDGHFGRFFYFTCGSFEDTKMVLSVLSQILS